MLFPLIKQHVEASTVIYTDSVPMYINLRTHSSKFNSMEMDYKHFYTNHNAGEYIHPKFQFVSSMNIEYEWSRFKQNNYHVFTTQDRRYLQLLCDSHCMQI